MIKHYACPKCYFRPMYYMEGCPKCGNELEEAEHRDATIIFKGNGFASNEK